MLMPVSRVTTEHSALRSHDDFIDCDRLTLGLKRTARFFGIIGGIVTAGVGMWAVHTASAYRKVITEDLATKGFVMGLWLIFSGASCAVLESSLKSNHRIRGVVHVLIGAPMLVLLHLVPAAWIGCGFLIFCGVLNFLIAFRERSEIEEIEMGCGCSSCSCWCRRAR